MPPPKQPQDRLLTLAKKSAARALGAVGVPPFIRRFRRGRLAVLMYHGIEPRELSPPCWHVLGAATLRRQLHYVRRHFHVLPLEEALERLETGNLPDNAVALTFDDGTHNLLTHAAPILRDLRLPAAVFLSTGAMGTDQALWTDRLWLALARTRATDIDLSELGLGMRSLHSREDCGTVYAAAVDRFKELPEAERTVRLASVIDTLMPEGVGDPGPFRMLSWADAHELADGGLVTLHPHTVTHPILSTCPDDMVESEIAESCAVVERETGRAPTVFAYPNGRAQDFDSRAKDALRRRGVRWALSTTSGLAGPDSDPLEVPRLGVGSDMSFGQFRVLVSASVR